MYTDLHPQFCSVKYTVLVKKCNDSEQNNHVVLLQESESRSGEIVKIEVNKTMSTIIWILYLKQQQQKIFFGVFAV